MSSSLPQVQRLAAIDIGSNSIRLVVAELLPGGQFRVLDEERETTRLGKSLVSSGRLSDAAVDATITALRRFLTIAAGFEVQVSRVIATCAVREAENGAQLCRQVRDQLGVEIEVISSYEEAQFAFVSVKQAYDITDRNVAVADLGGGSTEVVFASGGYIEEIFPTPLGAVRLAEMCGRNRLFGEDYQKLVSEIDRMLKRRITKLPFVPQIVYGTGGTFTNLASMLLASRDLPQTALVGCRCTRADVKHLAERLQTLSLKQRRNYPGLNADRADIIVPGLVIIDRLMRRLEVNLLQVHFGGVRDGLLWSMVHSLQPVLRNDLDREQAVRRFAESCGVDWTHSRHVGHLARQIYQQLSATLELPVDDAELIETAARLQDVGYLINYDQHHKHSYHLICNSRLPGFHRRDLELIANIARYHRGAKPKRKHDSFRQLSAEQQQRVRWAAAILRLAGGLDRSHTQQVRNVSVSHGDGVTRLNLECQGDPEVDLWAARRRAAFFEKIFATELVLQTRRADGNESRDGDEGGDGKGR